METKTELKKLGFVGSFAIYVPAAMLLYFSTNYLIPFLSRITNQETILFWFIVAGLGVFTPLIITAIIILKFEGYKLSSKTWKDRLRFRKITSRDLVWSILGLIIIGVLSSLTMEALKLVVGDFDHSPSFMSFEPLTEWKILVTAGLASLLDSKYSWRRISLERSYASKTRNCLWKTCMVNSWFWLGVISYCIWMAIINNINSNNFYPIICCSKN